MRTKDTEIEAHGYGLIVAMMAVILIIAALGFGAVVGPTLVSMVKQSAQAEPATPVKPPAS